VIARRCKMSVEPEDEWKGFARTSAAGIKPKEQETERKKEGRKEGGKEGRKTNKRTLNRGRKERQGKGHRNGKKMDTTKKMKQTQEAKRLFWRCFSISFAQQMAMPRHQFLSPGGRWFVHDSHPLTVYGFDGRIASYCIDS
jgi:hypothetical protein